MTFIEIDKQRYRQRLNRVIVIFVSGFALLALAIGGLLIALFSAPDADNFAYNLSGVAIALVVCGGFLNTFKDKPYFHEIMYVWQLKQLQNKIYRKLVKIKAAAKDNNIDALNILYFYYQSLQQVYLLDDNTLTMTKVNQDLTVLLDQIESLQLDKNTLVFDEALIKNF